MAWLFQNTAEFLQSLIDNKALGQKTGAGIFKKVGKEIQVLDLVGYGLRPSVAQVAPEVLAILKDKNPRANSKHCVNRTPTSAIPLGLFPRSISLLRLSFG